MLGHCPECDGKVSSKAPSCPHCGYFPPGGMWSRSSTDASSDGQSDSRHEEQEEQNKRRAAHLKTYLDRLQRMPIRLDFPSNPEDVLATQASTLGVAHDPTTDKVLAGLARYKPQVLSGAYSYPARECMTQFACWQTGMGPSGALTPSRYWKRLPVLREIYTRFDDLAPDARKNICHTIGQLILHGYELRILVELLATPLGNKDSNAWIAIPQVPIKEDLWSCNEFDEDDPRSTVESLWSRWTDDLGHNCNRNFKDIVVDDVNGVDMFAFTTPLFPDLYEYSTEEMLLGFCNYVDDTFANSIEKIIGQRPGLFKKGAAKLLRHVCVLGGVILRRFEVEPTIKAKEEKEEFERG